MIPVQSELKWYVIDSFFHQYNLTIHRELLKKPTAFGQPLILTRFIELMIR